MIPDVYVNFSFSLLEPEFTNLNVPYGAVKKSGIGYRGNGVIVFRDGQDGFGAFDATCPQHLDINASVDLSENGVGKATCGHCSTVYFLMNNGYPASGHRLKPYRVTVSAGRVYVTSN